MIVFLQSVYSLNLRYFTVFSLPQTGWLGPLHNTFDDSFLFCFDKTSKLLGRLCTKMLFTSVKGIDDANQLTSDSEQLRRVEKINL